MARYQVSVEVIKSYIVTIQATSAEEAVQRVENAPLSRIETEGDYVDTQIDVDTEPERVGLED